MRNPGSTRLDPCHVLTLDLLNQDGEIEQFEVCYSWEWRHVDGGPSSVLWPTLRDDREVYSHALKRAMTWDEMVERVSYVAKEWIEEQLADKRIDPYYHGEGPFAAW